MIEFNERVARPQFVLDFLPGDEFSRSLQQQGQHAEGLILQPDLLPVLAQLSREKVRFEHPKANGPARFGICTHGWALNTR